MKKNYKTKRRSAWLTLVLLMITALPVNAQNVRDRFQVDNGYWYEVVDAQEKTVKVTWANSNAATAQATRQVLASETADLPNEWKGYNGTPKVTLEEELKPGIYTDETPEAETKHNIHVVIIPATVKHNNIDWTVVAIGSYAFINERGIDKVELPESIKAIEDAAFYQCSVNTLNFPAKLKYIGWRAFYKTNLAPYMIETKGNKKNINILKNINPSKFQVQLPSVPKPLREVFQSQNLSVQI